MTRILDVKIDRVTRIDILAKIQAYLMVDSLHQIATVNPEFVMAARRDTKFKEILNQTDLNIPDGFGLQCAALYLGKKIGDRITGVDLTWEICKIASDHNYSVYFLGAKDGVAQSVAQKIRSIYPHLKISGADSSNPDDPGVIDHINQSDADILLVAYGAPKQEKFIFESKNQLQVKLAMGVGGTFDYIANIVPYAPSWMRKIGLEWLYRLFTQPKRWKRIFTATIMFPLVVIKSRFIKK